MRIYICIPEHHVEHLQDITQLYTCSNMIQLLLISVQYMSKIRSYSRLTHHSTLVLGDLILQSPKSHYWITANQMFFFWIRRRMNDKQPF